MNPVQVPFLPHSLLVPPYDRDHPFEITTARKERGFRLHRCDFLVGESTCSCYCSGRQRDHTQQKKWKQPQLPVWPSPFQHARGDRHLVLQQQYRIGRDQRRRPAECVRRELLAAIDA